MFCSRFTCKRRLESGEAYRLAGRNIRLGTRTGLPIISTLPLESMNYRYTYVEKSTRARGPYKTEDPFLESQYGPIQRNRII